MPEPLKNLYNEKFFRSLVRSFQSVYVNFDAEGFMTRIYDDQWENRELKDRLRHITRSLHATIALPYRETLEILKPVAAQQRYGFECMFFPDFVELYGMHDWEASLPALEFFTRFSSSEFAIRPFILAQPERMMMQMREWSTHENEHVRRLASEGCRPRLPWAIALPAFKKDPSLIFPILENLKADPSLYVRKSVANNLNDISKDHPQRVLETAENWIGTHAHTDWILKRACRTLLKNGDTRALMLFGFGNPYTVEARNLQVLPKLLQMGEEISFSFEVIHHSPQPQKLRIEYALGFVKANGSLSRKIFQITENFFEGGKPFSFTKKYTFRDMTTRKHYPGEHKIAILVNGEEKITTVFAVENK
ncbi:MAG: DNA alkylation repair protein [Bacteroidia bacterium]|nr:DNA alkylation repair protein [Bacteroidia bacterium]